MGKREEIREKRQREKRKNLLVATLVIAGAVILITAIVIYRSQAMIDSIITPTAIDFQQTDGMAMGDPDAPVTIVAGKNTSIPFNMKLEKACVPWASDIAAAVKRVLHFNLRDSREKIRTGKSGRLKPFLPITQSASRKVSIFVKPPAISIFFCHSGPPTLFFSPNFECEKSWFWWITVTAFVASITDIL